MNGERPDPQRTRDLELEERHLFYEIHYTLTRAALHGVIADRCLRDLNDRQNRAEENEHRRPSRLEVEFTLLANQGRIEGMQRLNVRAQEFIDRRQRILRELEAHGHHDRFWRRLTLTLRVERMRSGDFVGETTRWLLGPAGLMNWYFWFFMASAFPRGGVGVYWALFGWGGLR